jgi:hypothetical protein
MNEAVTVLERLERIRELDRRRAPAAELVGELRALVVEAERWATVDGDARARAAALELAGAVQRGAEVRRHSTAREPVAPRQP